MRTSSTIISLVLALLCSYVTLKAAPQAEPKDTTNRYIIDNKVVKLFDGSQLVGKKILSYQVSLLSSPSGRMVRLHEIRTAEAPVQEGEEVPVVSAPKEEEEYVPQMKDTRVNLGFSMQESDDLTYSVASIKTDDNNIHYSNMYEYLRGKVAGVHIGPDNSISIRGVNSINSSTEPLLLLDGMEIKDLLLVNPHDVYSVDVLKDSSASIYGMKGACGVILITTKAGQMQKDREAEARRQAKQAAKAARKARKEAK